MRTLYNLYLRHRSILAVVRHANRLQLHGNRLNGKGQKTKRVNQQSEGQGADSAAHLCDLESSVNCAEVVRPRAKTIQLQLIGPPVVPISKVPRSIPADSSSRASLRRSGRTKPWVDRTTLMVRRWTFGKLSASKSPAETSGDSGSRKGPASGLPHRNALTGL